MIEPAQGQVHGGETHHLRIDVGAVEGCLLQPLHGVAAQRVSEATPYGLAVGLDLLDPGGRGVGEPDMVPRADQEARRACRRIVDRLADPRIDQTDECADDMARRAELAELARLPDLARILHEQ